MDKEGSSPACRPRDSRSLDTRFGFGSLVSGRWIPGRWIPDRWIPGLWSGSLDTRSLVRVAGYQVAGSRSLVWVAGYQVASSGSLDTRSLDTRSLDTRSQVPGRWLSDQRPAWVEFGSFHQDESCAIFFGKESLTSNHFFWKGSC
ncbi:UNVERIFIED_CONTAM: hypothetical protein Slati_2449600 [Sesamum latifolium]|uniref:Uncharacterized protein n=1 Tax=Sesamum latifolium TaxID=2727402 RepID=A0AAW2WFU6_9LAMI